MNTRALSLVTELDSECVADDIDDKPPIGSTLKFRLSLLISALLLIVTMAGGVYVVQKARDDAREEARSTLTLTGHFLDTQIGVLAEHWAMHGYTAPRFRLRELGDIRHLSIKFYDGFDRLIDTNEDVDTAKPVAPSWFAMWVRQASTVSEPTVRELVYDGKIVGRLVIAPDPSYETEEMWTTAQGLLGLLATFFILVNVAVWFAASRAMRPVGRILQALGELRRGNLAARLPVFGLPELSRISVGFNHMAATLERSVTENQRLTRQLLTAQETERTNIARELHDEIGQCVSAIHADAAAIRNRGGDDVRESAEAIVEVVGHIKLIVRSMLERLRPPIIEGLGIAPALRHMVATFQQRNPGVACALRSGSDLDALGGEIAIALYRVVQECLTNITVHANAQRVSIDVRMQTGSGASSHRRSIQMTIEDDGVGFFLMSANSGFGLTGIQERVKVLGGASFIDTQPGRGTRINVSIPLTADDEVVS